MDLKYGFFLFGSECNTVLGCFECSSESCRSLELRVSLVVEWLLIPQASKCCMELSTYCNIHFASKVEEHCKRNLHVQYFVL